MYYDTKNNKIISRAGIKTANPQYSLPADFDELLDYKKIVYIEPSGTKGINQTTIASDVVMVEGVPTITKSYVDLPEATILKKMEQSVESYIDDTVKALGYNSQDSIAKYLVQGNPFYNECTAISLWIGSIWTYVVQVEADVKAGTRTQPTIDELLEELPDYVQAS